MDTWGSTEGSDASPAGAASSENAGMSNERRVKTPSVGSLRVPPLCQSTEG